MKAIKITSPKKVNVYTPTVEQGAELALIDLLEQVIDIADKQGWVTLDNEYKHPYNGVVPSSIKNMKHRMLACVAIISNELAWNPDLDDTNKSVYGCLYTKCVKRIYDEASSEDASTFYRLID